MKLFKRLCLSFILIAMTQLATQSCYYDNEQSLYHIRPVDCSKVLAGFKVDVMPILTNNCATSSCHNSTGVGGVILQTYDQIYSKIGRIRQRVLVDKTMPPNGALTTAELDIIQCWINAGAPNN